MSSNEETLLIEKKGYLESRKTSAPEYCRICAAQTPPNKLRSFAAQNSAASSLLAMIHKVNMNVHRSDGLPQTVCLWCVRRLKATKDFIEIVDAAQLKLKQLFPSLARQKPKKEIKKLDDIKIEIEVNSSSEESESDNYLSPTGNESVTEMKFEISEIKNEDSGDALLPATSGTHLEQKSPEIPTTTQVLNTMIMLPKDNNFPKMIEESPTKTLDPSLPRWSNYLCCKRCEQRFDTLDKLRDHSLDAHTRCAAFKCVNCPMRILTYKHFFQHMAKHDPTLRQCCEFCDECFVSSSDAKWHKKTKHEDIVKPHQCKNCGSFFDTPMQLQNHRESYTVIAAKTAGDRVFKCPQCPKISTNKIVMHRHIENHDRSKHFCEICKKTFSTKTNLSIHLRNVHNPKPQFICQKCGMFFKMNSSLTAHMSIHTGLKPYPCDVCHKMFRTVNQVKKHKVCHSVVKNYVCKICSKEYKYHTGLNDHMRTHDNIRPYACDVCPKKFINWPNYNKHMKAIHKKNMAKSANARAAIQV